MTSIQEKEGDNFIFIFLIGRKTVMIYILPLGKIKYNEA